MATPRYVKVAHIWRNFQNDIEAAAQSGAPFILVGNQVHLSNAYYPNMPVWTDRAAMSHELRGILAGMGSPTRIVTKWRADVYFENPDLGSPRSGWRDEWIAWMPKDLVISGLNEWTSAGRQLVWAHSGTPQGQAFWQRVLFKRWNEGLMPGLYAWNATEDVLNIGMVLTDLTNGDFRKWAILAAQDCHAQIGGHALIMPSKSGWLKFPQTWRATPTHEKWAAGGPLHDTPFAPGEYEDGYKRLIKDLAKKGLYCVLDDSPAPPEGPWSWLDQGAADKLLGEERGWP